MVSEQIFVSPVDSLLEFRGSHTPNVVDYSLQLCGSIKGFSIKHLFNAIWHYKFYSSLALHFQICLEYIAQNQNFNRPFEKVLFSCAFSVNPFMYFLWFISF